MKTHNFKKILIANRGEIALRIVRSCQEMGIGSVVVHSEADSDAMAVRLADESVCIGPAPARHSYLNIPALLTAASITGVDAIHPGIGFLAENADFAQMVEEHDFVFIGPTPDHIRMMGDKITAKQTVIAQGIPVVPGSDGAVNSLEEALDWGEKIGWPVLVKAASGGGGRGMKVAWNANEISEAYNLARSEAAAAFGDDAVYLEKYLPAPRHIEIQLLADQYGEVVHLGERDCSIQRRHQKLIEEAPSPALTQKERDKIGKLAAQAVKSIGYRGVGTMEFLYQDGAFYFIEMNTRLQVEHTISEEITGIDLVREQIRVAMGEPLGYSQKDIEFHGHAIECRINAEDPVNFMPSPGKVNMFHVAGGLGIRVDSAVYDGYVIPPHYDSMIAKLIVKHDDRQKCLARLDRALREFVIDGVKTGIPLQRDIIAQPGFIEGSYTIHWLEKWLEQR